MCVDAEWIHLVKASNKLWVIVNTELNFGMNGRCCVHGQLSDHYHLKDYGWKQFFGEEKKCVLHNIIFSTMLLLPPSQSKHCVQHWALQHPQTWTFSGVVMTVDGQQSHNFKCSAKEDCVLWDGKDWGKELVTHSSSCQYVDVCQQWFKKTITGLMPWLKCETPLKYKVDILPVETSGTSLTWQPTREIDSIIKKIIHTVGLLWNHRGYILKTTLVGESQLVNVSLWKTENCLLHGHAYWSMPMQVACLFTRHKWKTR